MSDARPTLWIVAGPNGAGKTTYAFRHIGAVAGTTRFVNLHEIARGLSPLDPTTERRRAARVALDMMGSLIGDRASFSLETTLSGRTHLGLIARAAANGLATNILFFGLPSPEACLTRIARRVTEGGHDVPDTDVRRRFDRGCASFPRYAAEATLWRVFDNTGRRPRAVAEGRGPCRAMLDPSLDGLAPALAKALAAMPPCPETP